MLVNLEEYQVKILADIAENLVLSSCPLADGSFVSKLHLSGSVLSEMQEISCLLDAAAENMSIQISNVTGFVNINDSTVSFDDAADPSALVSINMANNGAAVSLPGVAPASHTHQAADVSGVAPVSHTHQAADVSGVALAVHTHQADDVFGVPSHNHAVVQEFAKTWSFRGTGAAVSVTLPGHVNTVSGSVIAFVINNKTGGGFETCSRCIWS